MSFATVVSPPKKDEYQIVVVFTRSLKDDAGKALVTSAHMKDVRDRLLRAFTEELGSYLYKEDDCMAGHYRLAYMQMTPSQVRKAQDHIEGRNLWTND